MCNEFDNEKSMFCGSQVWLYLQKMANLAHAMSMSDVVDVTDMSDAETQCWDTAMQTICQASFVWPWQERDENLDKVCKLRWDLLAKQGPVSR